MRLPKSDTDLMVLEAMASAPRGMTGWIRADCPFCMINGQGSPDRHQSWGIYEPTGKWHCFRCSARGCLHEGMSPDTPDVNEDKPLVEYVEPPEGFIELASADGRAAISLEYARRYVLGRGLTWRTIEETKLGVCTAGKYAGRIVVPVFSPTGKGWVGFFSRLAMTKSQLAAAEREAAAKGFTVKRYLNHPGEWRKGLLYNQRALFEETDEPVGAFEGGFSSFGMWPDTVACLGKPTEDQKALLLGARRPIAVCLDGDAWEEGMWLAVWLRAHGKRAGFVHFPPRQDGNDVPFDWLRKEMRDCIERDIT